MSEAGHHSVKMNIGSYKKFELFWDEICACIEGGLKEKHFYFDFLFHFIVAYWDELEIAEQSDVQQTYQKIYGVTGPGFEQALTASSMMTSAFKFLNNNDYTVAKSTISLLSEFHTHYEDLNAYTFGEALCVLPAETQFPVKYLNAILKQIGADDILPAEHMVPRDVLEIVWLDRVSSIISENSLYAQKHDFLTPHPWTSEKIIDVFNKDLFETILNMCRSGEFQRSAEIRVLERIVFYCSDSDAERFRKFIFQKIFSSDDKSLLKWVGEVLPLPRLIAFLK